MRSMRLPHALRLLPALAAGIIACGGEKGPTQPAVPTKVVFTVQPTNATAGVAIASAVQVAIQDASGNTVPSATATVTVALGTNPGGATLLGTKTMNAGAGVASFGDLAIERAASGYTLVASSGALTGAISVPFAIAPAAKATLAVVVQPSAAAGAEPITPAVQVAVQDAFGNTVTAATDAVTVALAANPAAGTLTGTLTVAATQGTATFSNLRIDRSGSGYTLAASAGGLSGATSVPFAVTPAVPTKLVFTVQPTNATAGVPIASAVQVAIQDASGNTVTSATAPVTVALGTNPGGAPLLGTNTVNAVAGVASFRDLAIERAASYTLVASSGALTGAISVPFAIAPAAKTKLSVLVQPSPVGGAEPITPAVQVAVQDAFGNTVTAATDAVTVALGVNPGAGTLSGTLTVPATQGTATFSNLRIDLPGNGYTLVASTAALTGATSAPFAVTLTFAAVSAGLLHTCGVTAAGAAYCWGHNGYGQLGDRTMTSRLAPRLVGGGVTFAAVSAGGFHTCGLIAPRAVFCWGDNSHGQLGDGTTSGVSFAAVSAGYQHTCGVTAASAAYCWGGNAGRQLGDGTTTDRLTPVLVAGGVSFAAVSAGPFSHTCGLTATGAAYCWGHNGFGQLGDGTTTNRSSPVLVAGDVSFTTVSAGFDHTCGVTVTGTAYCWGRNASGQLGDGTTTTRLSPVPVPGGVSFAAVSAGNNHTCGVTAAGAAYCWGNNVSGNLGDGTTTNRASPRAVLGGLSFAAVRAGGGHTCGVTAAGAVYCWGRNDVGQLGDGTTTDRQTPVRVVQ